MQEMYDKNNARIDSSDTWLGLKKAAADYEFVATRKNDKQRDQQVEANCRQQRHAAEHPKHVNGA